MGTAVLLEAKQWLEANMQKQSREAAGSPSPAVLVPLPSELCDIALCPEVFLRPPTAGSLPPPPPPLQRQALQQVCDWCAAATCPVLHPLLLLVRVPEERPKGWHPPLLVIALVTERNREVALRMFSRWKAYLTNTRALRCS